VATKRGCRRRGRAIPSKRGGKCGAKLKKARRKKRR